MEIKNPIQNFGSKITDRFFWIWYRNWLELLFFNDKITW